MKFDFEALVAEKKKICKPVYVPSRVFYTTYMLLPPFEIIEHNNPPHKYYTQKRHVEMQIDTSKDFWKFRLYGMRLKSWTINCIVSLISMAWVGPLGLRCLFGTQEFKYDEYADYNTGRRMDSKRPTFLGVFNRVLEGIQKSREDFERMPDRGLLGKNISRYYNYL